MNQILYFATPCPLTERCKFSTRVFTSWIISGLFLGLIFGLLSLASETPNPLGDFFCALFGTPIAICTLGLIGLGVISARGDEEYYIGWYWYFFPIVTYAILGLWISFAILAIAGINLPKPKFVDNRKRKKRKPQKAKILKIAKQNKNLLEKEKERINKLKKEIVERQKEVNLPLQEKEKDLYENLSLCELVIDKLASLLASLSFEEIVSRSDELFTEEEINCLLLILEGLGLVD